MYYFVCVFLITTLRFCRRSAYIDLYADWVFRVEDTSAAAVCANAPPALKQACEHTAGQHAAAAQAKPKKVRARRSRWGHERERGD